MSPFSFETIFADIMTDFLLFGPTLRAFSLKNQKIGHKISKNRFKRKENGDIGQDIFMC